MLTHWRVRVAVAIAMVAASTLEGQVLGGVAAGSRIRVTAPAVLLDSASGTVVSVTADSLQFRRSGIWTTIALADVTRLDVRTGTRSHGFLGIGLGFLGGAIVGTVMSGPDDPGFSAYSALFGIVGGLAGGIVGLMATTERWEPVTLERTGSR